MINRPSKKTGQQRGQHRVLGLISMVAVLVYARFQRVLWSARQSDSVRVCTAFFAKASGLGLEKLPLVIRRGLHRGQPDTLLAVVTNQEFHPAVAQFAGPTTVSPGARWEAVVGRVSAEGIAQVYV